MDFVSRTGQSPIVWPKTLYEENEHELLPVVVMANLVYGLSTLYYQVLWKTGIRGTKTEYTERIKKCMLADCNRCEKDLTSYYSAKYLHEHGLPVAPARPKQD